MCNTISGAIFLAQGKTPSPLNDPPIMCRVSGWFSQSNAQAVDFNILIISIVVLLSVVKKNSITNLSMKWQVCLCILAWIPGFITGKSLFSYSAKCCDMLRDGLRADSNLNRHCWSS